MPIHVRWLVRDQILLLQNVGDITIADLIQTDQTVLPMMDQSPHSIIHIIFDDHQQTSIPGLKDMKNIQYLHHPKIGWVISQQKNPVMRMTGGIIGSVLNIRFRYFNSIQEGLKFLGKMDPSLPELAIMTQQLESPHS